MKIICHLVLYCYMFLLCCCIKEVDPISKQNGLQTTIQKTLKNSNENITNNLEDLQRPIQPQSKLKKEELKGLEELGTNTEIILTDEENKRFKTFENALNAMVALNHQFVLQYPNKRSRLIYNYEYQNHYRSNADNYADSKLSKLKEAYEEWSESYQEHINNYDNFMLWLEDNPIKKRNIVEFFSTAYDFLEKKRQKHATYLNINRYITSAIRWNQKRYYKDENDISRNGMYGPIGKTEQLDTNNCIYEFFHRTMLLFGGTYYIHIPILNYKLDNANNNYEGYIKLFNLLKSGLTTIGGLRDDDGLLYILKEEWGDE